MAPHLSAIILAAGFSSRMGELKALLPLGPTTVLGHCIKLFQDGGIEDVVVVTGHRAAETGEVARSSGARPVYNPNFASGMFTSIQAGVRQLEASCTGFFLLPVDIPLVRSGTVTQLADSFATSPLLVAYPIYAGERGHPPLISTELVPALLDYPHSEGGLRSLLATVAAQHPAQIRDVAVADANILFDMDTPEDYAVGRLRLERSDYPTMAECEVILHQLHPMPAKGLAHGRLVAEVAVALCEAVIRHSARPLDPELCRVCGWLHDIAKGSARHEEEGARWLQALGFDRAAAIVAAHKDLDWQPGMAISEKEIVHVADKLVRGSRTVSVGERFEEKMGLYRDDPEAIRAIRIRYNQALRLTAAIEAEAGQPIEVIVKKAIPA